MNICLHCGYLLNVTGNVPRCPECGRDSAKGELRRQIITVARGPIIFLWSLVARRHLFVGWWWVLDSKDDGRMVRRDMIVCLAQGLALGVFAVLLGNSIRTEVATTSSLVFRYADGSVARGLDGNPAPALPQVLFRVTYPAIGPFIREHEAIRRERSRVRIASRVNADGVRDHSRVFVEEDTNRRFRCVVDSASLVGAARWSLYIVGIWAIGWIAIYLRIRSNRAIVGALKIAAVNASFESALMVPVLGVVGLATSILDIVMRRLTATDLTRVPVEIRWVELSVPVVCGAAVWIFLIRSDRTGRLLRGGEPVPE